MLLAPPVQSGVASGFSRTEQERDLDELIQSVAREVEVTRRLYRSGESEYLLNGTLEAGSFGWQGSADGSVFLPLFNDVVHAHGG